MRDAVLAFMFSVLCLLGPLALALSPRDGEAVAVLAMPWPGASASATVAAADGRLLDLVANQLLAIAVDDSPEFVSRLYGAGALLVIDARAAAFCFPAANRPTPHQGPASA
ncbi:MAG TPA: hypothetical protein VH743_22410 [Beijerinckiaceae bacterium]